MHRSFGRGGLRMTILLLGMSLSGNARWESCWESLLGVVVGKGVRPAFIPTRAYSPPPLLLFSFRGNCLRGGFAVCVLHPFAHHAFHQSGRVLVHADGERISGGHNDLALALQVCL